MATKAELMYTADGTSLDKKGREFSLLPDVMERLKNFPKVIDNVTSTSSTDALSANMGKLLQDQINEMSGASTFLSLWDATTGLPQSNPTTNPYRYKVGNYYIVSKVAEAGGVNYRPRGTQYDAGVASTEVETENVNINDWYLYDGARWILLSNSGKEINIDTELSTTSTNAVENRVVTNALNNKQDIINDLNNIRDGAEKGATALQSGDNISELENNVGYQTEGDVVAKLTGYYTKDEIDEKENGYVKFGDNSPENTFISAYDANGNGFEFYPNSFYIENEDGDVEEYQFFGDYRIAKLNETMRGFPVPQRGDNISDIVSILKRNEPAYFYEKDGEVYKIWVAQSFNGSQIKSYMNNAGEYLDVGVNENGWECDGCTVANADLVYQQTYTWHYLPSNNTWDGSAFSQYRETSSSFTVNGNGLFRMGFEYKLKVKNTGHSTITVTLGNKLLNPRNIPTTIAKGKEVIFLFYSSHNTMSTMELAQRIERPIGEDMSNYYNKSEVDSLLEEKADSSDLDNKADKSELPDMNNYYNKTETDGLLDAKVDDTDLANYYTKTETDDLLDGKADKSDTYTKAEVDSAIAGVGGKGCLVYAEQKQYYMSQNQTTQFFSYTVPSDGVYFIHAHGYGNAINTTITAGTKSSSTSMMKAMLRQGDTISFTIFKRDNGSALITGEGMIFILESGINLLDYDSIISLLNDNTDAGIDELNKWPQEYYNKYNNEGHLTSMSVGGNTYQGIELNGRQIIYVESDSYWEYII